MVAVEGGVALAPAHDELVEVLLVAELGRVLFDAVGAQPGGEALPHINPGSVAVEKS